MSIAAPGPLPRETRNAVISGFLGPHKLPIIVFCVASWIAVEIVG